MANFLSAPSAIIGLMGAQRRNPNSLLPFPQQADAGDEWFTNPAGRQQGVGVPVLQNGQIGFDQSQPAQRGRVNPLNVLFRGLAPNLSGALDAERQRLQLEADRPQMLAQAQENENIARALGPQALLAYRTNDKALGEGLAAQYKPTTTGAGGVSTVFGTGQQVEAPRVLEFGNKLLQAGPLSGVQELAERGPSYAEQAQLANIQQQGDIAGARLGLDYDRLGQSQSQFDQRLGFDREKEGRKNAPDPKAAQARVQSLEASTRNLSSGLERSRGLINNAGVLQGLNPLARQGRANLEGSLNTLKANLTFDKLMEMKSGSANGSSGLGALSNYEAQLLASTVAALDIDMSAEELEKSFKIIDGLISRSNQELSDLRSRPQGGGQRGSTPALPAGFVLD